MNRCKVCVAPVLECKERRRLDSPQSEHCRAVLVGLACDVGITTNDAAKEYGSGFVCKKCFNLAATYFTLKEKLRNKLQETFRPRTNDGLNRIVKDAVGHLGANKTPQAIMRASKALGALKEILVHFDKSNKVWSFGNHTRRSDTEDLVKVITELTQSEVFKYICGRRHSTFPSMHCNKLLKVNQRKLDLWMKKRMLELLNVSPLSR